MTDDACVSIMQICIIHLLFRKRLKSNTVESYLDGNGGQEVIPKTELNQIGQDFDLWWDLLDVVTTKKQFCDMFVVLVDIVGDVVEVAVAEGD